MIEKESVIPIENGFYEAGKINPDQLIWGFKGLTELTKINYSSKSIGVLVQTKYFSIITSPHQLFITQKGDRQAQALKVGGTLFTDDSTQDTIVDIVVLDGTHEMYSIKTSDGTFKANGFYLKT